MSYGLLNTGGSIRNQAKAGMRQSASDETNRNIANTNIEQQEKMTRKTNAGAGLATGAMIGANAASGAIAAGTAAAGTGTLLASGLATGGIGLLAGLALTELL